MMPLNFTPFPILTTEHLTLRRPEPGDDNEIFLLRTDEGVNKFLDRPKASSMDDARKFIHKILTGISKNECVMWVITLKKSQKLLGTICFWNFSKDDDKAEIGYELLPHCQGKGIMNEAMAKIIEYGFNTMKLKNIEAYTHKDNDASSKLLEKHNFTRDEIAESKNAGNEEFKNMVIYSLHQ
jgi:[ribosomal protein S5]-alanine N-acetyltransferase